MPPEKHLKRCLVAYAHEPVEKLCIRQSGAFLWTDEMAKVSDNCGELSHYRDLREE